MINKILFCQFSQNEPNGTWPPYSTILFNYNLVLTQYPKQIRTSPLYTCFKCRQLNKEMFKKMYISSYCFYVINQNFLSVFLKDRAWFNKHLLKVPDMITTSSPTNFSTPLWFLYQRFVIFFFYFCAEIWCEYSKYLRRNQQKCCLEIRKHGHQTK